MEQTEAILQSTPGASRVKKGGGGAIVALAVLGGLAAACAAGYLVLCAFAAGSDTIWKNTYVLGQDLGGLTVEQAVRKVDDALPGLEIGVYLYDEALAYPPERTGGPDAVISLSDLDAVIDTENLVAQADRHARGSAFITAGWRYLTTNGLYYGGSAEDITVPEDAAKAAAEKAAETLAWPAQDTAYELGDDALLVTMAKDGRSVDAGALQEALSKGWWSSDLSLNLPYGTPPAKTMTAREIHEAVHGEMKNAGYDSATDTITPETVGADFDVSAAQKLMDAAQPGDTVSVPAAIERPAVTAEELKAVLFRDVLGSASTHVGGTSIRRGNVKLAGESCNGVVLNDGDVFDYNAVVGKRTTDRGFGAAPAYVNGETVDTIGGGICQVSSTIYYATLLANLEIVERYAHRYAPSYITWGMDATVSWGGPEFRFKNDTGYPIRLDVTYDSKNNIKVDIVGTKTDDTYVKMTYKNLGDIPYETERIETADLDWGTEQQKQSPYTGHQVVSYRNVYKGDGTLISSTQEAKSNYKSRNEIILVGTRGKPAMGTTIPEFGGESGGGTGGETGPTLPPDDWTDGPILPPEPELPDDGSPGLAIFG